MSATGNWNLSIKTPMGEQKVFVQLVVEGTTLTGTMQDAKEPALPIKDGRVDGGKLEWKFDAKKPFPMTLLFAVQADGDAMTGTAKAGIFPPAPVIGRRA